MLPKPCAESRGAQRLNTTRTAKQALIRTNETTLERENPDRSNIKSKLLREKHTESGKPRSLFGSLANHA
jgi:hypothetical protein